MFQELGPSSSLISVDEGRHSFFKTPQLLIRDDAMATLIQDLQRLRAEVQEAEARAVARKRTALN